MNIECREKEIQFFLIFKNQQKYMDTWNFGIPFSYPIIIDMKFTFQFSG